MRRCQSKNKFLLHPATGRPRSKWLANKTVFVSPARTVAPGSRAINIIAPVRKLANIDMATTIPQPMEKVMLKNRYEMV